MQQMHEGVCAAKKETKTREKKGGESNKLNLSCRVTRQGMYVCVGGSSEDRRRQRQEEY